MTLFNILAYVLVFLIFVIPSYKCQDECLTPNKINDWRRSAAHETNAQDNICDSFLRPQWYKITSKAGERMPTECITAYKCGSAVPFWLSRLGLLDTEATFPDTDEIVERTACGSHYSGDCCQYNTTIQIKNCTDYLVYFLNPTPYCPTGYCFGSEVPCPSGQYSDTGFTPGCGSFPNVTIDPKPKVTTGFHRTDTDTEIFQRVKFQCNAKVETTYTVDVFWYINGVEITEAYYENMMADQLNDALLLQNHWEKKYKPNMNVSCAMRLRQLGYDAPGPLQFSDSFFAGLIIDYREEHKILIENGPPQNMTARLTIPVSCSYPTNSAFQLIEQKQCVVNFLGAIPVYQKDSNCNLQKVATGLNFHAVKCGIYFQYSTWNHTQVLSVSGRPDNIVNLEPRVMNLRLYTNALRAGTDKEVLKFWDGFIYPDLKFLVKDSDFENANAVCSSDNDPHMTTFDGERYTFHNTPGEYILYKHEQMPVEIHAYYQKCDYYRKENGGALCNCGVAVRSGESVFIANFCSIGLHENKYAIKKICDAQELKVTGGNQKYKIATMSGSEVEVTFGEVTKPNEDFYGIQRLHVSASNLDKGLTSGLCGSFNDNAGDDMIPYGEQTAVGDAEYFAESYRLKPGQQDDSLFDINYLKTIPQKAKPYCYCQKEAEYFPYGEPNFYCNYTTSLDLCTKVTVTNTVYQAPCKEDNLRTKRNADRRKRETVQSRPLPGDNIKIRDDNAPIMYAMDITEGVSSPPDLTWKNSWTEEKAKAHCTNAFKNSASFSVCTEHIPTVPVDDYIDKCVADIRLEGHTNWERISVNNYGSACLQVASKLENLTQTNQTSVSGEEKSIFDIIQESTCPLNCSGNGNCIGGQCICRDPYFGPACNTEKTKAPKISKRSFQGLCDTNFKPCHKYIISGYNFLEGSVSCRYTKFTITLNETSKTGMSETAQGIYLNPFSVQCPAPLSRRKRSIIGQKSSAFGYFISISNDGQNFTEDLTVIIYNSTCFDCNTENMTCIPVEDCADAADDEKEDRSKVGMYIGIGTGGLFFVIIGLYTACKIKKRCNRREQAIHCSSISLNSIPPASHRISRRWTEERGQVYDRQYASKLPPIRGK